MNLCVVHRDNERQPGVDGSLLKVRGRTVELYDIGMGGLERGHR